MTAQIDIIIATHNRPEVLARTIRGVLWQTRSDWRLTIVGDQCDGRTARAVGRFADARIRYVNLPERSGEQSIPNSVGLALADAPFVALLNHDDLWLPDHLETALERLAGGADFYTAPAAFVGRSKGLRGLFVPRFSRRSGRRRRLEEAFFRRFHHFEPVSAWVMRRTAMLQLWPFTPALRIHRTPLEDFVLRAWRAGLAHVDGDTITVIKDNAKAQPGEGPIYAETRLEMVSLAWRVRLFGAADLRRRIEAQYPPGPTAMRPQTPRQRDGGAGLSRSVEEVAQAALTPEDARAFLETGRDALAERLAESGFEPGWRLREALRQRTGETLRDPPSIESMVRFARTEFDR